MSSFCKVDIMNELLNAYPKYKSAHSQVQNYRNAMGAGNAVLDFTGASATCNTAICNFVEYFDTCGLIISDSAGGSQAAR